MDNDKLLELIMSESRLLNHDINSIKVQFEYIGSGLDSLLEGHERILELIPDFREDI